MDAAVRAIVFVVSFGAYIIYYFSCKMRLSRTVCDVRCTVSVSGSYTDQTLEGFMLVAVPLNAQDETTAMGTFQVTVFSPPTSEFTAKSVALVTIF